MSKIINSITDSIDKVSSPSSRAGSTVERAGKMLNNGVSENVIALQMTENSHNKQKYTVQDVRAYAKLYKDAKTKVVITKTQAESLIDDVQNKNKVPADGIFQP